MCKGDGRKPVKTYKPMTIKKFTKLFVPPVVFKAWNRIRGTKEVEAQLRPSPLPQIERHSDKMVLIGNGPSLMKSVELYKDEILKNDRIAVNFFASSELFEQLKPNLYVFADPAFFDVPENQKESIETLFENIAQKTMWEMRIIIPYTAKDSEIVNTLKNNRNISVDCYSNTNQTIGAMSKFEAWDRNLLCPPSQNVLNVALYLSLYWEYKETYLIGADSSFLEDLRVDQETNELFTLDSHFYRNKDIQKDKGFYDQKERGRSRSDWKLHDLIYAHGRMFEYFYELKKYSDYKGLKVYNASEYSWINVFERRKLK